MACASVRSRRACHSEPPLTKAPLASGSALLSTCLSSPFADTRHTSRFMVIWLTLVPFTLWEPCGWATVPLCLIIAFLLLGGCSDSCTASCLHSCLCMAGWVAATGAAPVRAPKCWSAHVRPLSYTQAWCNRPYERLCWHTIGYDHWLPCLCPLGLQALRRLGWTLRSRSGAAAWLSEACRIAQQRTVCHPEAAKLGCLRPAGLRSSLQYDTLRQPNTTHRACSLHCSILALEAICATAERDVAQLRRIHGLAGECWKSVWGSSEGGDGGSGSGGDVELEV